MAQLDTSKGPNDKIVYVRTVATSALPDDVRGKIPVETVYAIHNSDGAQLALVGDRKMAFAVARQHGMGPVSVH